MRNEFFVVGGEVGIVIGTECNGHPIRNGLQVRATREDGVNRGTGNQEI